MPESPPLERKGPRAERFVMGRKRVEGEDAWSRKAAGKSTV